MKFCDERIQRHLLNGGKIRRVDSDCIIYLNDNCELYCESSYPDLYFLVKKDLTTDDWEIVEPEYNWDKIIEDKILCIFSQQENFDYKIISTVSEKDKYNSCYFTYQGTWYKYCKPFNPADFNIAKDLKEYEK